jgi:hypothetical protein
MPFRTPLLVRHDVGEQWCLLDPLIFEGRDEFFVMRRGFTTDFASVPRPVRWLFDSAGHNSEAGVLHDAVWRESKRRDGRTPRIDPWDADGIFRRALRESGATTATRSLMWLAVRATAILSGRFGHSGPSLPVKVLQVVGIAVIGVVGVLIPTAVALAGMFVYFLIEWLVALPWAVFERITKRSSNLPWPLGPKRDRIEAAPKEYLAIFPKTGTRGDALATLLGSGDHVVVSDDQIESLLRRTD